MLPATYNVHNAQHLKRIALNHRQKVQALYKAALKVIRFKYDDLLETREKAVELRARFDANRDVKDFRLAKKLLKDGEHELLMNGLHEEYNFTFSPNGTAYQAEPTPTDVLIDYWHPLEKAMFPYYFARREERKKEYIKLFESEYGNSEKLLGIEEKFDYAAFVEELNDKLNLKKDK